jgi:hypothetical protein
MTSNTTNSSSLARYAWLSIAAVGPRYCAHRCCEHSLVGRIVYKSVSGLMDAALPAEERDILQKVLAVYMQNGVACLAIRLWRQFYRTAIHFIGTAWLANRRSP